jgi:hypothetical protein
MSSVCPYCIIQNIIAAFTQNDFYCEANLFDDVVTADGQSEFESQQ